MTYTLSKGSIQRITDTVHRVDRLTLDRTREGSLRRASITSSSSIGVYKVVISNILTTTAYSNYYNAVAYGLNDDINDPEIEGIDCIAATLVLIQDTIPEGTIVQAFTTGTSYPEPSIEDPNKTIPILSIIIPIWTLAEMEADPGA